MTTPSVSALVAGSLRCLADRRRELERLEAQLIGAHAAVAGHRLLTRDVNRYRTHFPSLQLIAPDRSRPGSPRTFEDWICAGESSSATRLPRS